MQLLFVALHLALAASISHLNQGNSMSQASTGGQWLVHLSELPEKYGEPYTYGESVFGYHPGRSKQVGAAVKTVAANLRTLFGAPMTLPGWAGRAPRQGYVFRRKDAPMFGMYIVLQEASVQAICLDDPTAPPGHCPSKPTRVPRPAMAKLVHWEFDHRTRPAGTNIRLGRKREDRIYDWFEGLARVGEPPRSLP